MSNGKGTLTSGSSGQDGEVYVNDLASNQSSGLYQRLGIRIPITFAEVRPGSMVEFTYNSEANPSLTVVATLNPAIGNTDTFGEQLTVLNPGGSGLQSGDPIEIDQYNNAGFTEVPVTFAIFKSATEDIAHYLSVIS